jgi:hypothetical protein
MAGDGLSAATPTPGLRRIGTPIRDLLRLSASFLFCDPRPNPEDGFAELRPAYEKVLRSL